MKPTFLFSAVFDLSHLHLSPALVVSSKIHIQLNTYTVPKESTIVSPFDEDEKRKQRPLLLNWQKSKKEKIKSKNQNIYSQTGSSARDRNWYLT